MRRGRGPTVAEPVYRAAAAAAAASKAGQALRVRRSLFQNSLAELPFRLLALLQGQAVLHHYLGLHRVPGYEPPHVHLLLLAVTASAPDGLRFVHECLGKRGRDHRVHEQDVVRAGQIRSRGVVFKAHEQDPWHPGRNPLPGLIGFLEGLQRLRLFERRPGERHVGQAVAVERLLDAVLDQFPLGENDALRGGIVLENLLEHQDYRLDFAAVFLYRLPLILRDDPRLPLFVPELPVV
mmetsp:Transcript_14740/g.36758  ORF Transcript_14740/g.36758 Transcript_14740/m.36758 type:complete len:237 (-) Transcript_14740:4318-5028(-)